MSALAGPVVTVDLFGVRLRRVPAAVARMALDRGPLRRTPGLSFFKLVGTGDGRTFTMRDADPRRWGVIAVWSDDAARRRFEQSATLRAWQRLSVERLRLTLLPVRSRGHWAGQEPFATPAAADHVTEGPVAALTRARIRWRHARTFWSAVPAVSADLGRAPGLRWSIGFGEAPIGLQGTLSLWESAAALQRFAYARAPHRTAIARTQQVGWYAEELFARFVVLGCAGTVDGRNPLPELEASGAADA